MASVENPAHQLVPPAQARSNAELRRTRQHRILRLIAIGCLAVFVVSVAMIVVGDPFWNFFVIAFGFLVAAPVGVVAAVLLLIRSRKALAARAGNRR